MQNVLVLIVVVVAVAAYFGMKLASQVSADEARKLLAEGGRVIDVRTPGEFASAHIASAVNVPLNSDMAGIDNVAKAKDTPLLLHCHSGGRSAMACRILRKQGYTRVYNLGGFGRAQQIVEAGK